jgi:transcriptional regulator with XRE-family HTH domain
MPLRNAETLGESDLRDLRGHEVSNDLGPVHVDSLRNFDILRQRLPGCQAIQDPDMEKERTPFGRRMRQARLDAGLTQVTVAQKAGISQSTLSDIETASNGSSYTPVLAALYHADAHYLATGRAAKGALSPWAMRVATLVDEFQPHLREQAMWRCQGALDAMQRALEGPLSPEPNPERSGNRA